jgi:hypothetical protein
MGHRIILLVHFIQLEIFGGLLNRMVVTVPQSLRFKQQKVGSFLLKIKVQKEKVKQSKLLNSLEHLKVVVTLTAHKIAKRVFSNIFMESKKSSQMIHFVMSIGKDRLSNNRKIICQRTQQQVEVKQVLGNHQDQAGIEI